MNLHTYSMPPASVILLAASTRQNRCVKTRGLLLPLPRNCAGLGSLWWAEDYHKRMVGFFGEQGYNGRDLETPNLPVHIESLVARGCQRGLHAVALQELSHPSL